MRRRTLAFLIWLVVPSLCAADGTGTEGRFSPGGKLFIGACAATAVSLSYDAEIREHLLNYKNSDPSRDLRRLGDKGQLIGPVMGAGFLLQGLLAKNATSLDTGALLLESAVVSTLVTSSLKYAVGRQRPCDTDDPYTLNPGGHDSSFPSGHTTVVFSAATVLFEQYPSPAMAVAAYGVAGAVGFSRMYANKHWFSDVLAGATVGSTTSHLLRRHQRSSSRQKATTWFFDGEQVVCSRRF